MVELYTIDKFVDGIETLLKKTMSDLGAMRGSLMLVDQASGVLRVKVALSDDPERPVDINLALGTEASLDESISGLAAKTKEPLLINDIKDLLKKFPNIKLNTTASRYTSSLVVPVVEDGLSIAVLNINDKKDGGKFTRDNIQLASMLAQYCGVVLKLERMNKGILHVNEIIREISLTNSLPDVYQLVVAKGAEILGCAEASLMLVDKHDDGSFHLVVKESTDPEIVGESRQLGESVSGYVWKTGEPVLIKSIEDGKTDRRFKILNKPGSFIVVPLNLKYRTPYALNVALKSVSTIGVLNFTHRPDGKPFSDEHLEAIVNYSNLVAIAIEKARYYNESKLAYLSTVKALSAALESKDKYTKGHSDSVEYICSGIANRMGFSPKQKEDLQIAALLHDIGKIGIPESILNKTGSLTPAEYERIKTHIDEAENILQHTFYLENSRDIIKTHHEHFDGSGYPLGLKGEDIPIGGRILATVDAFHAMTSNRPYRNAMDEHAVKAELVRCRGKQFDPKVVDLLVEFIEDGNLITAEG